MTTAERRKEGRKEGRQQQQRPFFLSRTSKVKVQAGMNFELDEHNRARIWARLRIRHGSG
jgi:hypothetical protein